MNVVRRAMTLLALTTAVVIGSSVSASAELSGAAAVAPAVGTGSVAAPASTTITAYCSTTSWSYWNGFQTVSARVDRSNLAYQPTISVLTLTGYGWTAESARKAVPTC